MKTVTLLFLRDKENERILLAMKKRGFGEGKLNGVGGKVQEGETILEAALRETEEEIGVSVPEEHARQVGRLHFHFTEHPEWEFDCHVFMTETWEGEPAESEEMAPEWHDIAALPFERMWVDDKHWLPTALAGEYVDAHFEFGGDGEYIERYVLNGMHHEELRRKD